MATGKPKVSAYLDPDIMGHLKAFMQERNVKLSEAVGIILSDYFGLSQAAGTGLAVMAKEDDRLSQLEALVTSLQEQVLALSEAVKTLQDSPPVSSGQGSEKLEASTEPAEPRHRDPLSHIPTIVLEDWDLYDADITQLPGEQPTDPLTQRQLSELTGIPSTTLQKHKLRPDFSEWIQDRSPQGFIYTYSSEDNLFYPQLEPPVETAADL